MGLLKVMEAVEAIRKQHWLTMMEEIHDKDIAYLKAHPEPPDYDGTTEYPRRIRKLHDIASAWSSASLDRCIESFKYWAKRAGMSRAESDKLDRQAKIDQCERELGRLKTEK